MRQLAPVGSVRVPAGARPCLRGRAAVALWAATERRRALAVPGALAAWLLVTTVALTANRTGSGSARWPRPLRGARAARAPGRPGRAGRDRRGRGQRARSCTATSPAPGDGARLAALLPAAVVVVAGRRGPSARARAARARAGPRPSASPPCSPRPPSSSAIADRRAAPTRATGASVSGAPRCTPRRQRPVQGFGAGTFLAATRARQLKERPVPTRFAHDLALQEWVEVGLGGLLAVLAWYVAVATTLVREIAPPKPNGAAWLLAPAVAAFPLANLLDWPWALAGTGALWAVALGGLLAWREHPPDARGGANARVRACSAPGGQPPEGGAGAAWVPPPELLPPPPPPPSAEAAATATAAAAEQAGEAARRRRRRRVDLRRGDRPARALRPLDDDGVAGMDGAGARRRGAVDLRVARRLDADRVAVAVLDVERAAALVGHRADRWRCPGRRRGPAKPPRAAPRRAGAQPGAGPPARRRAVAPPPCCRPGPSGPRRRR